MTTKLLQFLTLSTSALSFGQVTTTTVERDRVGNIQSIKTETDIIKGFYPVEYTAYFKVTKSNVSSIRKIQSELSNLSLQFNGHNHLSIFNKVKKLKETTDKFYDELKKGKLSKKEFEKINLMFTYLMIDLASVITQCDAAIDKLVDELKPYEAATRNPYTGLKRANVSYHTKSSMGQLSNVKQRYVLLKKRTLVICELMNDNLSKFQHVAGLNKQTVSARPWQTTQIMLVRPKSQTEKRRQEILKEESKTENSIWTQ